MSIKTFSAFKWQWKNPQVCKHSTANNMSFIQCFNLVNPFELHLNWSLWIVSSSALGSIGVKYNLSSGISMFNASSTGRISLWLNNGHIWSSIILTSFASTIFTATTSSLYVRTVMTEANPPSQSGFRYVKFFFSKKFIPASLTFYRVNFGKVEVSFFSNKRLLNK